MSNNKKIIISIITPSFNQGKFIERTIKSIWDQDGDFYIEHIIADGGSSDNTAEIVKRYEKLLNENKYSIRCNGIELKWWSKKDDGQADALDKAFRISKGEILTWLNSDDTYCSQNSLKKIIDGFNKANADVVVGNARYIDEEDNFIQDSQYIKKVPEGFLEDRLMKSLYQFDFIPQPSAFFTKKLYNVIKIDKKWFYGMDWDLWIKAYQNGFKFYKINDLIGNLRSQKNAKTYIGGVKFYQEKLKFYRQYGIWGLNRVFCYFAIATSKIQKLPFIGKISANIINFLLRSFGFLRRIILKNSIPIG